MSRNGHPKSTTGETQRERGAAAVWTLMLASGMFLLLLGLVVDGAAATEDQVAAKRAAEQAARGAADELSSSGVRSQTDTLDAVRAAARAQELLDETGWVGTVRVAGDTVRVEVTGPPTRTTFLQVVGVRSIPISVHGTATAISGPSG